MARKHEPTAADKAKWTEERTAKVEAAKARLERGLAALTTSDDWSAMLTRVAHDVRARYSMRRYSFRNQIMIEVEAEEREMPAPSSVATFNAWKRCGRTVRKGERCLVILQPTPITKEKADGTESKFMLFRPIAVFDISQTDGPDLAPLPDRCPDVETPEGFALSIDAFRTAALNPEGVRGIDVRPRAKGDHRTAHGWYQPASKHIVVLTDSGPAQAFKTLAHEVAHALMHDVASAHEYAGNEVEAESVAFIVSSVMGLATDGYSFPYVATWASRSDEKDAATAVAKSGERIMRAAKVILDALLGAEADDKDSSDE